MSHARGTVEAGAGLLFGKVCKCFLGYLRFIRQERRLAIGHIFFSNNGNACTPAHDTPQFLEGTIADMQRELVC